MGSSMSKGQNRKETRRNENITEWLQKSRPELSVENERHFARKKRSSVLGENKRARMGEHERRRWLVSMLETERRGNRRLQTDAELRTRRVDSDHNTRYDREVAEQLQAEMGWEDAPENHLWPSEVRFFYDRNSSDRSRSSTQQSQSQATNDSVFAQILQEEEDERAAREIEEALNNIKERPEEGGRAAEQFQIEMGWEDVFENHLMPSEVRSSYDRNPKDRSRSSTQQSQSQATNDSVFAQILQEEEDERAAREIEEALNNTRVWPEEGGRSVDRRQRRSRTVPSKANAPPNARSIQSGQAQVSQRFQAVPRTVTAPGDPHDMVECSICTDSFPKKRLINPCEHFFCRPCMIGWFQKVVDEKPKQQPRCCDRILAVDLVSQQLRPAFVTKYKLFELEIETPNPLHCSKQSCSAFIQPKNIHGDIGECKCGRRTCRHCRAQEHIDRLCVEDKEIQIVEGMGKRKGWKRCPGCGNMIEKDEGCLHMKCTQCGTDFCWVCMRTDCDTTAHLDERRQYQPAPLPAFPAMPFQGWYTPRG